MPAGNEAAHGPIALSADEFDNRLERPRQCPFHLGTQPGTDQVKTGTLDADQINPLRHFFRIEFPAHLECLPDPYAVTADRPHPGCRDLVPGKHVNTSGNGSELDGINDDQQLFTTEFINHCNAADTELTETHILVLQRVPQQTEQPVPERIIGHKVIADADNKAAGHYPFNPLNSREKRQVSPASMVFGLAGLPVSSAMIPAI